MTTPNQNEMTKILQQKKKNPKKNQAKKKMDQIQLPREEARIQTGRFPKIKICAFRGSTPQEMQFSGTIRHQKGSGNESKAPILS
jgi:hypothetical protein